MQAPRGPRRQSALRRKVVDDGVGANKAGLSPQLNKLNQRPCILNSHALALCIRAISMTTVEPTVFVQATGCLSSCQLVLKASADKLLCLSPFSVGLVCLDPRLPLSVLPLLALPFVETSSRTSDKACCSHALCTFSDQLGSHRTQLISASYRSSCRRC